MSDFRDIEVKASNQSLIISIIIGVLSLSILFITLKFEDTYPKFQPIEIAMNFGESNVGQGDAEPLPSESIEASSSSSSAVEQPQTNNVTAPSTKVATQNTPETRPVVKSNPKPTTKPNTQSTSQPTTSPKPKGDTKGNAALQNLIGGKGKSSSGGEGNNGVAGNVGDPKGDDSSGMGIGDKWRSRIPEPQRHDCPTSGVIIVDVIVNSKGNIKSAIPGARGSTSNDTCLKNKAKELVEKYVRAEPGKDGRKGTYKVNLR